MTKATRNVVETRLVRIWEDDDGIVWAVVHSPRAQAALQDAVEAIEVFKDIVKARGKRILLYTDARNVQNADRDARQYSARPESAEYVKANAILIGSPVTRILVNFYIRVSKPHHPVKFFTSEEDALAWLKTFMD